MDNSSNSGADAAYEKALAAYQEKSYEVARRWVVEALAHNRHHSGARALLGRLEAARTAASPFHAPALGSEVVSTDPTILISRASGSAPMPESIEPTVMVRRDDPRYRPSDTDPRITFPPIPPSRTNAHPVSEPTLIGQPKPRTGSSRPPKSSFSLGAALQSFGERLQGRGSRPGQSSTPRARSTGSGMSTPAARGALLAVATVAVGALLVWGLFLAVRWVWPPGQMLTLTPPTGGTITGPGIECGAGGIRCSASFSPGEVVELGTRNDKGYVFSGFTGPCAPTGRISMTEARTCGAVFGPVETGGSPATFRLTITKPEGGTIVGAGMLCGTIGSMCTADLPSGVPVSLRNQADDGFSFDQFTGDCPSTGEMTMTSAKTCGAIFIKSSAPINRVPAGPPVASGPRPKPVAPGPNPGPVAPPNPQPQPGAGQTNPAGPQPLPPANPTNPTTPAPPAQTQDDHAKEEILRLTNKYCSALESMKPEQVRSLFHDNERDLKTYFKEVKSLKCTVTGPPSYDRLDSGDVGGAQVKFGVKMVVKMSTSGAPETRDMIVTMVVSRKGYQAPFLIDRVQTDEKPK